MFPLLSPALHARRLLAGLALVTAFLVGATDAPAAENRPGATSPDPEASSAELAHHPPVDAPIVDAFRPPATPYGPGNRGLEYDTRPGQEVRATAAGIVAFAGMVGGRLVVTVRHSARLRTTYTGLRSLAVTRGDRVAAGQRLGRALERFHLGAIRDGAYIDPSALFGRAVIHVRLVSRSAAAGVRLRRVGTNRSPVPVRPRHRPDRLRRWSTSGPGTANAAPVTSLAGVIPRSWPSGRVDAGVANRWGRSAPWPSSR